MTRADRLLLPIAVVALGAVGAALYTQHVWNMQPCAWCVLQRLIFVAVAVAALLGLVWRGTRGARLGSGLVLALAACGAAAALWQHFVAAAQASCDLTLAERIVGATGLDARYPDVFMAMASCAEAKVNLFGVPYEFWSLALFVALGAAAWAALRRPR